MGQAEKWRGVDSIRIYRKDIKIMIRVDSLEQYKKLRESGFTDDIMVLMKGGEADEEVGGNGETEEAGEIKEAGKIEEAREENIVQFDYDKVISELEKRLIPVIQRENREAGGSQVSEDDDIAAIMKKFTEM